MCARARESRSMISAPKGIRESLASLKNCRPKGIPTMVTHKSAPMIRWPRAIHIPKKISQITFTRKDTVPPPYSTSRPKGHRDSDANLKHCSPYGMPIMVMHQISPEKHQQIALRSPPKISHNMLPMVLMLPPFTSHTPGLTNI